MKQKKWLPALLIVMALSSCDREGRPVEEFGLSKLSKGVSDEGDVRAAMGQPETTWAEGDGSRRLQYPKGPQGPRTWEFIIDKSGKLKDYRQLLTPENFARVHTGMSQDEVRRLLGKPRTVVQFALKNEEVWDWLYQEQTEQRLFNVHFDITSGKVTGTSASSATNY